MTDKSPIRLHAPPGINFGLIERAVGIVVETCSPRTVYLVGSTAVGYVEYNRVELVVVVDDGDTEQIWDDVTWALTDEFIDGDVSVYTLEEFEECRTNSCLNAYEAEKYGRIAYERGSAKQSIDSGDTFHEHVVEADSRAGRTDSDGKTVLPADRDDPLDEVHSAMEADEKGFVCILDEDIIGTVFEEAADKGTTLYLSRAGALQLKLPLPVQVSHDVRWTVAPIGLQVHGTGDTPIEALEDMVAAFNEALELFCGPDVPPDDPTKMMFAAYVRFDTDIEGIGERTDPSVESGSECEYRDRFAVEIARLAQGTPIVGYHDADGHLVIPIEYDDDYLGNRGSINRIPSSPSVTPEERSEPDTFVDTDSPENGTGCGDPHVRERNVIERMVADHRALLDNSSAPVDPAVKDAVLNDFPLQAVCDARERTDDCFMFAAIALENICIYHPFADGNKRTALATALRILDAGGFTLPDGTGLSRYVKEVAMGLHDRDEIAEWLRENSVGLRGL